MALEFYDVIGSICMATKDFNVYRMMPTAGMAVFRRFYWWCKVSPSDFLLLKHKL